MLIHEFKLVKVMDLFQCLKVIKFRNQKKKLRCKFRLSDH